MSDMVSKFIIDVSEAEFADAVVQQSHERPVVVDFWAPWCGPCRALGPVLERLANEFQGAFILARVNTDENPNLAREFGIQSIPNVMLFRNGQVVDQFIGALPELDIRQWLRPYCPSEADRLVAIGNRLREQGQTDAAAEAFERALALDATHAGAHLGLAWLAFERGEEEQVEQHVAMIPPLSPELETAERLREALAFHRECRAAGGEEVCRQRLSGNPNDLDARFGLAACLAAAGKYADALEEFLAIVAKDKHYRDEAARKAMLTIFSLVGERSELAEEYRKRLAWTLY